MTRPLVDMLRDAGLTRLAERDPDARAGVVLGTIAPGPFGPRLVQQEWRQDASPPYFYPASTVKLVATAAMLSWLGFAVPFDIDADRSHVRLHDHPSSPDSASLGLLLRRIGAVSCNPSYNTLFDALGAASFRALFARWGVFARITHQLSPAIPKPLEAYLHSPGATWTLHEREPGTGHVELRTPPAIAELPAGPSDPTELVGRAHVLCSQRHDGPMNFSPRNRIELADLQRMLCAITTPQAHGGLRLFLRDHARRVLVEALTLTPREIASLSGPQCLDAAEADLDDTWGKLFLAAARRSFPGLAIRHTSKFGQAYGFTTENALLTAPGKPAVFLAATIHTNDGGIVGGDDYQYGRATEFFSGLAAAVLGELWAL